MGSSLWLQTHSSLTESSSTTLHHCSLFLKLSSTLLRFWTHGFGSSGRSRHNFCCLAKACARWIPLHGSCWSDALSNSCFLLSSCRSSSSNVGTGLSIRRSSCVAGGCCHGWGGAAVRGNLWGTNLFYFNLLFFFWKYQSRFRVIIMWNVKWSLNHS